MLTIVFFESGLLIILGIYMMSLAWHRKPRWTVPTSPAFDEQAAARTYRTPATTPKGHLVVEYEPPPTIGVVLEKPGAARFRAQCTHCEAVFTYGFADTQESTALRRICCPACKGICLHSFSRGIS